ncbi:DUF5718 family protein [Helicobacter sp. T3_23-1059]
MQDLDKVLGLGLAGNFANHLEQAGEAGDFACIIGDEECAPKGIFPFFVPDSSGILGRFCFDDKAVVLPNDTNLVIQAEAEVGLECDIIYEEKNGKKCVQSVVPKYFMAFDDASVRNDKDAQKLSLKKNFSIASKGFSPQKIAIDEFSPSGICNDYSIVSFVKSNGKLHQYGELRELSTYSYFYEKLILWIVKKLNTQEDFGVLENLPSVLAEAKYPKKAIIAIGATRYTHECEHRFLSEGDLVSVIVFNHHKYSFDEISKIASSEDIYATARGLSDISVLAQRVVRQ